MKYLFLSMALVAAFFAFDSGQSDTVRWISGGLCLFLAAVDVWLCLKGKKRPAPVRQQPEAQPVAPSLDLPDWEPETFSGLRPATSPKAGAAEKGEKKNSWIWGYALYTVVMTGAIIWLFYGQIVWLVLMLLLLVVLRVGWGFIFRWHKKPTWAFAILLITGGFFTWFPPTIFLMIHFFFGR